MQRGFPLGFALLGLDHFLPQFTLGGEGAAIDDSKGFFVFLV